MVKFFRTIRYMPLIGKILICCLLGPIGIVLVVMSYVFESGFETNEKFQAVLNNPCDYTVNDLLDNLGNSPYGINNHPDNWQRVRGVWNVVNRSDKVSTPVKEKLLAQLLSMDVHLNNTTVNDNYAPDSVSGTADATQDDNFMQDEMNRQFMEQSLNESLKAVTPADHGGYVQGDGFNPSDTMAADADRQAQSMNDMNNMGMF